MGRATQPLCGLPQNILPVRAFVLFVERNGSTRTDDRVGCGCGTDWGTGIERQSGQPNGRTRLQP